MDNSLANKISEWSGYSKCNNLGKYLGVPVLHSRISFSTYSYLLENIQERLLGWKTENLLMAGRVTLCKSVILALPLYTMQFIAFPKAICNEIEKFCRRFIWGDTKSRKRVHLINWKQICQSLTNKYKEHKDHE